MSIQLSLNILQEAALLLLVASSFAPLYYITKFINISHGITIALGSYCTILLTHNFHFPLVAAIPLAIVMASLFGVASEVFVYRHLRGLEVSSLSHLIASIGIYVICQNCISLAFGDQSRRIDEQDIQLGHYVFGGYISTVAIDTILLSGVIFLVLLVLATRSRWGLEIRAVSDNGELSAIYGIDPDKAILRTYLFSSATGAVTGILFSLATSLYPTMGFNLLLFGLTAMIIGGVGSYKGLVGGSLIVVAARQLAGYYIDAKWMDTAAYVILLLFLIWKPYGLSGKRLRKVEI